MRKQILDEDDISPITFQEIDDIADPYNNSGSNSGITGGSGSNSDVFPDYDGDISDEDIESVLGGTYVGDDSDDSDIDYDVPHDYDGDISDDEIGNILNS